MTSRPRNPLPRERRVARTPRVTLKKPDGRELAPDAQAGTGEEERIVESRVMARTGWQVSVVGLGWWQLGSDWGRVDEAQAMEILHAAVDAGVTFLDTADVRRRTQRGGHREVPGRAG
jgi:Aldo/keto reductase family